MHSSTVTFWKCIASFSFSFSFFANCWLFTGATKHHLFDDRVTRGVGLFMIWGLVRFESNRSSCAAKALLSFSGSLQFLESVRVKEDG